MSRPLRAVKQLLSAVALGLASVTCGGGELPPLPPPQPPEVPRTWLFAAGVSTYKDDAFSLKYADKDAEAIADFFTSPSGGRLPAERVKKLLNQQANRTDILSALEEIADRSAEEDMIVIFLSMHATGVSGEPFYFFAYDTEPRKLLATGISEDDLKRAIARARAKRVILLIDTCHAGSFGFNDLNGKRGLRAEENRRLLASLANLVERGTGVLAASGQNEYSEEAARWGGGHGVFTHYLLGGLKGDADDNHDGVISLRELYDYVYPRVRNDRASEQHPNIMGNDKLLLVRVPRSTCAEGTVWNGQACAASLAESSGAAPAPGSRGAPAAPAASPAPSPVPQSSLLEEEMRDDRRKAPARSRQLLVTEIQGLESLYDSTPKNALSRPGLMRRLAEHYVELESRAHNDKAENERKAAEAWLKHPGKALAEAGEADKILAASRQAAIKYYTGLARQYPRWCLNADVLTPERSTGCTDEVLYYLAYEYEKAGQLDQARKVYLELIHDWPQSKYIPNAHLALGELFFNEAQGEPSKWALAERSYEEVIKYPPPDNKAWGYAHYNLGRFAWDKDDFARAMSEFKKAIEYSMQYASLPGAEQLGIAARRDIIGAYVLAGAPAQAREFLAPLSGDPKGKTERLEGMLSDLGRAYLYASQVSASLTVYLDLLTHGSAPTSCTYLSQVDAVVADAKRKGAKLDDIEKKINDSTKALTKARLDCAH